MICIYCLKGGEENKSKHLKRSAHWHEKCEGKGCVCQHKTGPGWVKGDDSKATLMQIQSP